MTFIRNIPNRLSKFRTFASDKIGKKINIGVLPSINVMGNKSVYIGVSATEVMGQLKELPVYIVQSPLLLDKENRLTEYGENTVAHEISHYIAHNNGYHQDFLPDIIINNNLSDEIVEISKGINYSIFVFTINELTSHLIVNNILGMHGFEPENARYIPNFISEVSPQLKTLGTKTLEEISALIRTDIIKKHIGLARTTKAPQINQLSEVYVYLPDPFRQELLSNAAPFYSENIIALINKLGLNVPSKYLYSKEYGEQASLEYFNELTDDVYSFYGDNGNYFTIDKKPSTQLSEQVYELAKNAMNDRQYLTALACIACVTNKDVSELRSEIEEEVLKIALSKIPQKELYYAYQWLRDYYAENDANAIILVMHYQELMDKIEDDHKRPHKVFFGDHEALIKDNKP